MPDHKYIGHPTTRIDGLEKVTGAAQYVDDINFGPDLLHAAIEAMPSWNQPPGLQTSWPLRFFCAARSM